MRRFDVETEALSAHLTPAQKMTLQLGSMVVMGLLSLGLGLGRWPLWSAPVAGGLYLAWTVAYAEATILAARRSGRKAERRPA